MEEIALHHYSNRLPSSISIKPHSLNNYHNSRDPTLTAPKNLIQSDDIDNRGHGQGYASDRISSQGNWMEKQGGHTQAASKSIYQALKRSFRRLSGFRRNNSA